MLDNASNPSQAVQNVQKFIGDSKYVGILGSGNAAAAVATGPLASQAGIPFLALSPPTTLVAPPQPVRLRRAAATARLYAYNEAAYLRKLGDHEGLADGRQRRLRSRRPGAGRRSSRARTGFRSWTRRSSRPATTDFTAELTKVKNSGAAGALALDRDTGRVDDREAVPAAPAAAAARADRCQHVSAASSQGNCPDVNGAVINSYLGTVVGVPPEDEPRAGAGAQLLQKMIKRDVSNFDVDTGTALWTFKAAIEKGGLSRVGDQHRRSRRRSSGFVTPGGRSSDSRKTNHTGRLNVDSRCGPGRSPNCKPKPLFGAAFGVIK